ncbi:DUF559 domain-containing protein [Aeromicrobium alkaliterrae]|uniref:DUF559 domain-containing protein n=1 Tax=Aeromicrobium alkaliterrae TaxID=302168 RepID=A0ABP4VVZ3_9ACTN
MHPVPDPLHGHPFTRAEAAALGVTDSALRGRRFVRMHEGVYRTAQTEETLDVRLRAARLTLPPGVAISHTTNLRLRGFVIGPVLPLHFAARHRHQHRDPAIVLHRYRHELEFEMRHGFVVLPPARTFVDLGTMLDDRRLLQVGDWMVGTGLVTLMDLRGYCLESHLDGVRRARRVAELVRERVASPRESDLRWWIHRAGLPEPEVNVDIVDDQGRWLARGDLVYRRRKVLVEYDGWQHERDARQRQWDHLRREQLEAAGWRVIVITVADMAKPHTVIARIRQALASAA